MKSGNEYGFLMTDALAALFILSSVSAGMIGSFSAARNASAYAGEKISALFLAKECLAQAELIDETQNVSGTVYTIRSQEVPLFPSETLSGFIKRECEISWVRSAQRRQLVLTDVGEAN